MKKSINTIAYLLVIAGCMTAGFPTRCMEWTKTESKPLVNLNSPQEPSFAFDSFSAETYTEIQFLQSLQSQIQVQLREIQSYPQLHLFQARLQLARLEQEQQALLRTQLQEKLQAQLQEEQRQVQLQQEQQAHQLAHLQAQLLHKQQKAQLQQELRQAQLQTKLETALQIKLESHVNFVKYSPDNKKILT